MKSGLTPITMTKDGQRLDFIHTFSGRKVRPLSLSVDDIDITDIAHSLAMQARFGGMTSEFYSVAQHSVLVSRACSRNCALEGLLHDAAEAYLKDMPAPVKYSNAFAGYRKAEAKVDAVIRDRFDLPSSETPEVKLADTILVHTEGRDLFPAGSHVAWLDETMTLRKHIEPWHWRRAESEFLIAFLEFESVPQWRLSQA